MNNHSDGTWKTDKYYCKRTGLFFVDSIFLGILGEFTIA